VGGFLNALSFLSPVAPAQQDARDIRTDRSTAAAQEADRAQAAAQERQMRALQIQQEPAQAALATQQGTLGLQRTQQEINKGNQPTIIGDPEWDSTKGKYTVLALDPTKGLTRIDAPGGESPEQQASDRTKLYQTTYKQAKDLGQPDEVADAIAAATAGIKLPTQRYAANVVPDPSSPTGFSKQEIDPLTGQVISNVPTVPPRSLIPSDTERSSTDPVTGLVTHSSSVRKPIIGGQAPPGAPVSTPRGPAPTAPGGTRPGTASPYALDAQGHIPPRPGLNENIRAAANDMIDGQDENKIETKLRGPARALVSAYQGPQGKYTPQQLTMFREATYRIQKALNDPTTLSLLDSQGSRAKLTAMLAEDDHGVAGLAKSSAKYLANSTATPAEQDYRNMMTQLRETIIGMSGLVRTGRATQTQVNAMAANLPEPSNTTNAADARKKLQNLMTQLTLAQRNGPLSDILKGTGVSSPNSPVQPGVPFDPNAILRQAGVIK
jgi:hypothetical protein